MKLYQTLSLILRQDKKDLSLLHIMSRFFLFFCILSIVGCGSGGGGGNGGSSSSGSGDEGGSEWAWISGSSSDNTSGVYGTQLIPASSNIPPAKRGHATWADSSGNFWLFGGQSNGGLLNDLWKYDGTNWTWVSGSNDTYQYGTYDSTDDAENVPGARTGHATWVDSEGHLWLFGGNGCEEGQTDKLICRNSLLNDLWRYDGTNWTWISGSTTGNSEGVYGTKGVANSANIPGARVYAFSWIDSNDNLWLFGGQTGCNGNGCYLSYYLNDLWKYDGTNWTWISGSDSIRETGVYGSQGIGAPDNVPGARYSGISWTDTYGNFWLFGGYGVDASGNSSYLNDLWKYDGVYWSWISGSDTGNQNGSYTSDNTSDAFPGGRKGSTGQIDSNNTLWLFGGYGYASEGTYEILNDLWKFDGSEWIWVSGSNKGNQTAIYDSKGSFSATAEPGGRSNSSSWIDSNDQFWLFGGQTTNSEGSTVLRNDLWKFRE